MLLELAAKDAAGHEKEDTAAALMPDGVASDT